MSRPIRRLSLRAAVALAPVCTILAVAIAPVSALAQAQPLSIRNSFRVGTSGVACTAQISTADVRLKGMFDRGYLLSCRDAAGAVGSLIAVRRNVALGSEPSALAATAFECGEAGRSTLDGIGAVDTISCRDPKSKVDYRRYAVRRNGVSYLVEGLAGYDPALRLALATVVNDRPQPGEIRVASTEVSDAAAFARVQAGLLDAQNARDEAYLRNNGGRFAESSEFFENLVQKDGANGPGLAEALANQGLQQSNLGNFGTAARLLSEAEGKAARSDGVSQRLIRNYRAINALNQRKPSAALAELGKDVVPVGTEINDGNLREGYINLPLSEQINRENLGLQRLGGIDASLTPAERAEILDAQAQALTGTAKRQEGKLDEAAKLFASAGERLAAIRDGRVQSTGWLRSEILIELALIAEAQGRASDAGTSFDRAIAAIGEAYPQSPALLAARARKAAFLGRSGDGTAARAAYASIVEDSATVPDAGSTLRYMLAPYFGLLANDGSAEAPAALFKAAQVLQRPGVAQTQAILAREMSEGNDDASALFRLSVARSREIARTEAEIATLSAITAPTPQDIENLSVARESLENLRREQTELVSKLSAFPRYNVLSPQSVSLTDLQGALREGEAYYKLMVVSDELYALFVTPSAARIVPIEGGRAALEKDVSTIRDSIVRIENGEQVNYPFDVVRARQLYLKLFGPIDAAMPGVKHLIFEPDGPMLQLPPYLLVTGDKGVDAYRARTARAGSDAFDFTGVEWLGRGREVSIAVSPRGFLDIRALKPSSAPRSYLGLGHNAVPSVRPVAAVATECDWPLATWQAPIAADELYFAKAKLGRGGSEVITDAGFTDSALLANPTLDEYRVLHFATHGLVTAPRPDCPARPALVTSFGDSGSDGLLSFREIFDLKLDADVVILSACDTAGMATVSASREAGVTTGGNYALDGLVRAFVGAGARSVVASHWPVPDDFDATKRLIGGMLDAAPGEPLAQALADAQEKLMDDPDTSHPFYWAAFIILGDGAKPIVPARTASAAELPKPAR
ncbi:CHAT domain-containing protein [Novosphingobium tardum]|uniref:CHAT domain-containing protein n=1 Tax=Novosphingobium tardum TaxID=1538021 RepID=A0ABV8RQZ1_9SPHN